MAILSATTMCTFIGPQGPRNNTNINTLPTVVLIVLNRVPSLAFKSLHFACREPLKHTCSVGHCLLFGIAPGFRVLGYVLYIESNTKCHILAIFGGGGLLEV